MAKSCIWGSHLKSGGWVDCNKRKRREDGLFECPNFKAKPLVTLDTIPDPSEELFPEHDYGRK